MAQSWQVKVGTKLSKPYSVAQLQRKLTQGLVKKDMECTVDNGESFQRLDSVLSGASEAPAPLDDVSVPLAATSISLPRQKTREPTGAGASRTKLMASTKLSAAAATNDATRLPPAYQRLLDESRPDNDESTEIYTIPQIQTAAVDEPPVREFLEPQMSPIALAAAAALKSQERTENQDVEPLKRRHSASRPIAPASSADDDIIDESIDASERRSHLKTILLGIVILIGISAAGTLGFWYRSGGGPPTFEDLTGGALAIGTFRTDDPVTLEEVHARTQILGVQVSRISKALMELSGTDNSSERTTVTIPELPDSTPALPFVPFARRRFSNDEQAMVDNARDRYTQLVKTSGPDGRQLDEATVSLHTGHLALLASAVDATSVTREQALFELSEWVKLTYLLQLKHFSSPDSSVRSAASTRILNCGNAGLQQVYAEIAAGDMRFNEIFGAAESSEKPGLLLIRYWYHRSHNRTTADNWLTAVMETIDAEQHEAIRNSIAEVDAIEDHRVSN